MTLHYQGEIGKPNIGILLNLGINVRDEYVQIFLSLDRLRYYFIFLFSIMS